MSIDWNDPEERLKLLESVGGPEYHRLMNEHREKTIIEVVNGYNLRWEQSRFGLLCGVEGTYKAFRTIELAREYALSLKPMKVMTLAK